MTYAAYDASTQDGDPVYLLLFVRDGSAWRYTTAPLAITALGETWLASGIGFGAKKISRESSKNGISFEFPKNNEFAQAYLAGRPDAVTSITVHRGHIGDADDEWALWWKGRDVLTEYGQGKITIRADSIITTSKQNGLGRNYQKNCPHALYQRGCYVDRANFSDAITITAVAGAAVTIELPDPAPADGHYRGGVFEAADGTLRFIREHSGTAITLAWPIDGLEAGEHILSPGCPHTLAACNSRFNNVDNYGGQPWIPGGNKNPMGGNSIA